MVNNCFFSSSLADYFRFIYFYRCGRGLFQKCVSIVKKQADKVIADDYKLLTYLIFDAPTHGGKYEDRVKWLQANIPQDDDKCFATVVGIKKCEGLAQLKQFLADVNKVGGEGIMLRKPGSLYEHKRSTTLLKVKTFYDEGKSSISFIFFSS
jgi:DNA ligase-1